MLFGTQKFGLHELSTLDTQTKGIIWWMTTSASMDEISGSYKRLAPDLTRSKSMLKLPLGEQRVLDGTFGKQLIGLNTLGTLDTQNKSIIHWMTSLSSMKKIKREEQQFWYRSLAPDMIQAISIPKLFPEIKQGGYIFITVDDNGTIYNLSFEGIETN